jgi:hypothetical protein
MGQQWNEARLQSYLNNKTPESLTLDYKAPDALNKEDWTELCKDVSAFANSDGGTIIYGMHEDKTQHPPVPSRIEGIVNPNITSERIEQILTSRIHGKIEDCQIVEFSLQTGGVAFVIEIGQAKTRAPHQGPNNKYYKRHNFISLPMEDYEVRDALRRAEAPELYLELSLERDMVVVMPGPNATLSTPIPLLLTIGNRAQEPARFASIALDIDERLVVQEQKAAVHDAGGVVHVSPSWKHKGVHEIEVHGKRHAIIRLTRNYGQAGELPVFFDNPETLDGPATVCIQGGARNYPGVEFNYYVGWTIKAPKMREQRDACWLWLVNSGLRVLPFEARPTG